jgi:hypothetical protein
MSIYRLCESHICRPQSALNAAAYRSGECLEYAGKIFDYTWRNDVICAEIMLPADAPQEFLDRQTLWSAAEKAEDASTRRKTARTAHEILISLPGELTFDTSIIIAKEFIKNCFVSKGMCADFAVHDGNGKERDSHDTEMSEIAPHNPHCHIMLTTRHVSSEGFSKYKAREWESWNNSTLLLQWREEWREILNRTLERKGFNRVPEQNRNINRKPRDDKRGKCRERI